jgi:hypothetical protein
MLVLLKNKKRRDFQKVADLLLLLVFLHLINILLHQMQLKKLLSISLKLMEVKNQLPVFKLIRKLFILHTTTLMIMHLLLLVKIMLLSVHGMVKNLIRKWDNVTHSALFHSQPLKKLLRLLFLQAIQVIFANGKEGKFLKKLVTTKVQCTVLSLELTKQLEVKLF